MSDISVLTHEYKTASEFLKKLNDAVSVVKRVHYNLPGKEAITQEYILASQQVLSDALTHILNMLVPEEKREQSPKEQLIPRSFTERLYETKKGEIEYYLADLKETREHLEGSVQRLSQKDVSVLDSLANAAEAEATWVFRKLWRR